MLTEEPGYTDVAALSAFARDRNNGLERFSIQWRVTEPPNQCLRNHRRAGGMPDGRHSRRRCAMNSRDSAAWVTRGEQYERR